MVNQHTNPAPPSSCSLCISAWKSFTSNIFQQNYNFPFLCFKGSMGCMLGLFQQVYSPQIHFPMLIILHTWQEQKKGIG